MATIHHGDCLEVLRGMADASVDAVVTDPPYGLSFMGKKWDYDVPSAGIWRECLRVLKPGGHLLAFAGTRTQHRMAVNIEDAGFEIRDMIAWVYGSGFPKSLDVSKAIDRAAGAQREIVGPNKFAALNGKSNVHCYGEASRPDETAPATSAARQWQGWGTALKPALEPITVARKPFVGTVAANVLAHGTGALNVDGCRVRDGSETGREKPVYAANHGNAVYGAGMGGGAWENTAGRWPANLIHDGSEEVVGLFPQSNGGAFPKKSNVPTGRHYEGGWGAVNNGSRTEMGEGSAARFFYCAKASKADRDEGLDAEPDRYMAASNQAQAQLKRGVLHDGKSGVNTAKVRKNNHPTVKPTALMRYLCRLVTPPKGIVLDPFMGSGSTGKAAMLEGFQFIGIEREAEYVKIAKARIDAAFVQQDLFAA